MHLITLDITKSCVFRLNLLWLVWKIVLNFYFLSSNLFEIIFKCPTKDFHKILCLPVKAFKMLHQEMTLEAYFLLFGEFFRHFSCCKIQTLWVWVCRIQILTNVSSPLTVIYFRLEHFCLNLKFLAAEIPITGKLIIHFC